MPWLRRAVGMVTARKTVVFGAKVRGSAVGISGPQRQNPHSGARPGLFSGQRVDSVMKVWQAARTHPLIALELRRMRRKRWWPDRWVLWVIPVVLGAALGMAILWIVYLLVGPQFPTGLAWVPITLTASSLPMGCVANVVGGLGTAALMWILPATIAVSIVREREQGTLDLLRVTVLSTRSLLFGKVGGCLVRWWPLFVVLVVLMPFQLVMASAGMGSFTQLIGMSLPVGGVSDLLDMGEVFQAGKKMIAIAVMIALLGWLRPWVDIALHGMIGLFASVLARSSNTAIALTYGAIIAIRVGNYLLNMMMSMFMPLVWLQSSFLTVGPSLEYEAGANSSLIESMLLMQGMITAIVILLELGGVGLLWWGAVRRMERE